MASWVGTLEQTAISPSACSLGHPAEPDGNEVAPTSRGTDSPGGESDATLEGEKTVSGGKFGSGTAQPPVWTV